MTKRKIHLAIAEDHTLVLQGYMALLQNNAKFKVVLIASNGKELLQKLTNNLPDIVLLDIEMPVLDGREAMRLLKKKYPKLKVIIVTSHYHQAYMLEFIKKWCLCIFTKKL
jgi:two-component system, NarL family, response regulator DegU